MLTDGKAQVVIGAGYGDEGKGLMTDALAATHGAAATVIRFNGGAQAGHTVTLADGRRHIFHHVGSGAFAGAATFLSRFFVANPMLLRREMADLARIGVTPRIAVDPAAAVTTPYDMMMNQIVETARGGGRHGSCGMGIGETIDRNLIPRFALTAEGTQNADFLRDLLGRIRREWVPARLARLGVTGLPEAARAHLDNTAIIERWLDEIAWFRRTVAIAPIAMLATRPRDTLIFEGAQGLLLDQDRGAFPHVTRSSTGLRNVLSLACDIGLRALDVTYVTRAYVTRHGAGPLAHALPAAPYPGITDATNVPNPWQGTLRFGTLDLDVLAQAIKEDLGDAEASGIPVRHRLGVTCLDQLGGRVAYVSGGQVRYATPRRLGEAAAAATRAAGYMASYGPTRATLHSDCQRVRLAA